jgi:hypothetical protein
VQNTQVYSDRYKLQADLDKLDDWTKVWQLAFVYDKCKVMRIGHNLAKYKLTMELATVRYEKDMGICETEKLTSI